MMVLVDTSVWIEHLRTGEPRLAEYLKNGLVLIHPFVLGELACGNLKNRDETFKDLAALPLTISSTHQETMLLVSERKLWGKGIGWVDAHLLASALLSGCRLWSFDERLNRVASDVGVSLHS